MMSQSILLFHVSFSPEDNRHLITGPKGKSEFCLPKTLNVP